MDDATLSPMALDLSITKSSGLKTRGVGYILNSTPETSTPADLSRTFLMKITSAVTSPWRARWKRFDSYLGSIQDITRPGTGNWTGMTENPPTGWPVGNHEYDIDLDDGHSHSNDGTFVVVWVSEEVAGVPVTFNPARPITAGDLNSLKYLYDPQVLTVSGQTNQFLTFKVEPSVSPYQYLNFNFGFLVDGVPQDVDPHVKNDG